MSLGDEQVMGPWLRRGRLYKWRRRNTSLGLAENDGRRASVPYVHVPLVPWPSHVTIEPDIAPGQHHRGRQNSRLDWGSHRVISRPLPVYAGMHRTTISPQQIRVAVTVFCLAFQFLSRKRLPVSARTPDQTSLQRDFCLMSGSLTLLVPTGSLLAVA